MGANIYGTLAPYKSESRIYVGSSVNQLYLNLLNPYHHFSWSKVYVDVEWPVFDDTSIIESDYKGSGLTKEEYENATYFDLNTFIESYGLTFKEYLESEDSILYPFFLDLVNEAKAIIRFSWFGVRWKRLVSLYIAHQLELFLETIKDVGLNRSLNSASIVDNGNEGSVKVKKEELHAFDRTVYGVIFWREYEPTARKMSPIWGVIV